MKLGIFMPNLAGAPGVSLAPSSTTPTLEYNVAVAQLDERIGFDFLLPATRWKSFGGASDQQGPGLDPFIWAAAVAMRTSRIGVWSTINAPIVPPMLCAKLGASIQEISGGRWGLNVVSGWNIPEIEMFGKTAVAHDERHAAAEEWVQVVRTAWTEQDFDFDGRYHRVYGGYLAPKPDPLPTMMVAGESSSSVDLSARLMDCHFMTSDDPANLATRVADVRARAAAHGRTLQLYCPLFVLARDTEAEAHAALERIVGDADLIAVDNVLRILNIKVKGDSRADRGYGQWRRSALEERLITAFLQPLLVGTPEQVAAKLGEYVAAGVDGVMLDWHDFLGELEYFGDRVLPLLEQAGLRAPFAGTVR